MEWVCTFPVLLVILNSDSHVWKRDHLCDPDDPGDPEWSN